MVGGGVERAFVLAQHRDGPGVFLARDALHRAGGLLHRHAQLAAAVDELKDTRVFEASG